jgi:hypothetical protein
VNDAQKSVPFPKSEGKVKIVLYLDGATYHLKVGDEEEIDTEIKKVKDPKGSLFVKRLGITIKDTEIEEYHGVIDIIDYKFEGEMDTVATAPPEQKKYFFTLNKSFSNCSVHKLLDLIHNLDSEMFEIIFHELDWKDMIEKSANSLSINEGDKT